VAYASVEHLQEYLDQVSDTVANVQQFVRMLNRATSIVRGAMRRALADDTFDYAEWGVASTRLVRSYGGDYLALPPHQAGSVTLVERQTTTSPIAYETVVDTWAAEGSRLYRPSRWGIDRYRVTAVWGYGPDVPAAIEEVTIEVAVNLWRGQDSGGYVTSVGVDGGGDTRVVAGLNKLQQQIIRDVADRLRMVAV
jgi:hypothetical protein